ncbi:hypothetical protein [Croceivirga sp. JEA036]|uniref:hypothetical protein n=1 Tax=Croceivirga sp. JEA036 TaxID=2721162 RepID=UPI001439479F|nr:hypothetical protein [Croceivirga sp. JEA036]NJB37612.1 hypothetical protein [Croceivirga sp. JEA036]
MNIICKQYRGLPLLLLYLVTLVQQLAFVPSEQIQKDVLSKDEQTFVVHQSIQKHEQQVQEVDYKPILTVKRQQNPFTKWFNKSIITKVLSANKTQQLAQKLLENNTLFPKFSKEDIVYPFHDFV